MTNPIKVQQRSYIKPSSVEVHKISKPKVYFTCNDAEYTCSK